MQVASCRSYYVPAICVVLLIPFCTWFAAGQTKNQLAAKYKEISTFEIRPGIVAFATFAKDGNVCRLIIEKPGYVGGQASGFETTLPGGQIDLLVDEVAPPDERGKPAKYLNSDSYIAGGASLIKQDYENVSVSLYGSASPEGPNHVNVIIIDWPKRDCPLR